MTTRIPPETQHSDTSLLTRAVIVVQGIVTLAACMFALPLGAVLALTNLVLAFSTRGTNRRIFAGFAIVGLLICAAIALFFLAASASSSVGPSTRLDGS